MRFVTVVTRSPDQIPAYLYQWTTILTVTTSPTSVRDYTVFLLAVDGDAQVQADQLSSGLHGARVHDTLADANANVVEQLVPQRYTPAGQAYRSS